MEIQLFNSPQFGEIRTTGTKDNPQFCLSDLCRILGLSVKGVGQRLDEGVISNYPLQTPGGVQLMKFVNEDGLFDVILESRKPEAKAFRKWVTSEVLPSIRKTGGYIQAKPEDTPEELMAKALLVAKNTLEQQKQKLQMLEGENALLEQENRELAPRAQYTDDVLQSKETYTFEQMAKQLNFRSVQKFTQTLVEKKICYKRSDTYMLYAEYSGQGYTTPRTHKWVRNDGSIGSRTYTVWTERGRMFLHKKFNVALQPVDLTMFNLQ